MKITADTNVLVRAIVGDDQRQARAAAIALKKAELVAVPLVCLCELAWVLQRVYRFASADVVLAITAILDTDSVATNRAAAEAGLAQLRAGGDFADGAICFEGRWLGAEGFVSFDRQAVELLSAQGLPARLLA